MNDLATTAAAFVEMAHRIVWCSVATVDRAGRPRSRVMHPIWTWEDERLTGWVGTVPTPMKRAHLERTPFASCHYWAPSQDTCTAECRAELVFDPGLRAQVWRLFEEAPEPVGYDPGNIPGWDGPTSEAYAVLRLEPWRLRVFPGTVLFGQGGEILTWRE